MTPKSSGGGASHGTLHGRRELDTVKSWTKHPARSVPFLAEAAPEKEQGETALSRTGVHSNLSIVFYRFRTRLAVDWPRIVPDFFLPQSHESTRLHGRVIFPTAIALRATPVADAASCGHFFVRLRMFWGTRNEPEDDKRQGADESKTRRAVGGQNGPKERLGSLREDPPPSAQPQPQ